MDPIEQFEQECRDETVGMGRDPAMAALSAQWLQLSLAHKYSYHFTALGRPIIQYPQDMVAVQELIWRIKPDLVIETGIAHGGSLIMSASMLVLLDYCEALEERRTLDPRVSRRRVLGIDIDIRAHNRAAIEAHPLSHKIDMIQGSSIAPETVARVREIAFGYHNVLIMLDSNHTHAHVLAELEAYAPLTSRGSYCIVFDTGIEDLPDSTYPDRPWGRGDNPKTAVWEYLRRLGAMQHLGADGTSLSFEIDTLLEKKLLITVAPDGYLKRI